MANIEKILAKDSWTGRELGIVKLTNVTLAYRSLLDKKAREPVVTQPVLDQMIATLDDKQLQTYRGYLSIQRWITFIFNAAQAQLQQAQLCFRTLVYYVKQASLAEDALKYARRIQADEDTTAFTSYTLEGYFRDADDYKDHQEIAADAHRLLIHSYIYVQGYNTFMDMIARRYDVPGLKVFKMNINILHEQIDELNASIEELTDKIKKFYDEDEAAKKLELLDTYFETIDYKAFTIPKKNIDMAKDLLKDFRAFEPGHEQSFVTVLCDIQANKRA